MRPEENTGSVVAALKCTVKLKNHVIFFYIPNSRKEKTCESVSKSHPTPTFSRFLFSKNGSDFAEIFV